MLTGGRDMTGQETLNDLLAALPEARQRQVIDFARFLVWQEGQTEEDAEWRAFGLMQLAKAYGPDEPEYTEADLKPGRS
jgi:hypothetical protein